MEDVGNFQPEMRKQQKGTLRVVCYVFFIISIGIGAFLNEAIAFFNEPNNLWMNDLEFFMTFGAAFLSALCFIFFAHRYGGAKPKPLYIGLFLLLFVGDVIAIVIFPETKAGVITRYTGVQEGYVYSISNMDKVRDICMFGMSCFYFYMIFAILPQTLSNKHSLNFILYAVVFVTAFVIVWSLVNEWEVYRKYADIHADITTGDYVSSCFYNRNTYGTFLLLGICCLGYLQCESHHFWNYILIAIFFLANLVTLSKTSIIASLLFTGAFLVFRFIQTFKEHKVKDILATLFLVAVIIFLAIARQSDNDFLRNNIFTKLYGNFLDSLSRRLEGTFLEDRTEIWISSYGMLDTPAAKIFGVGEINLYFLLGNAWAKFSDAVPLYWTHNGIAHTLAAGGYLRIAIYAATILIFIVQDVKLMVRKSSTAVVSLLFFIAFLIHGMTETTGFLMPDTKGLVLLVLVYCPVLTEAEKKDSADLSENFIGRVKYRYTLSPATRTSLWVAGVSIWLLYALAIAPVLNAAGVSFLYSSSFVPLAIMYSLTMPIYFFLSYTVKSKFGGLLARLLYLGLIASSFALVTIYDNLMLLLIPGLIVPVIIVLLAATNVKDLSRGYWWKLWWLYFVDILVKVAFAASNHLAFFLIARGEFELTPTASIVYIVCNALLFIFLVNASPLSGFYIYPFDLIAIHLDERINIAMRRYENWVSKRTKKYLEPKKEKKAMNNWLSSN